MSRDQTMSDTVRKTIIQHQQDRKEQAQIIQTLHTVISGINKKFGSTEEYLASMKHLKESINLKYQKTIHCYR